MGECCVWFLGIMLDLWILVVLRYLWNFFWYFGKVQFDCIFNEVSGLYEKYYMEIVSDWVEVFVDLVQLEFDLLEFFGFFDIEFVLVYLMYLFVGFYY